MPHFDFDSIRRNPTYTGDSLKVDINTQIGDRYGKTVTIKVNIFRKGTPEALLKLLTILKNIIKGQDLSTDTHKYRMAHNIIIREFLQTSKKNTREK